jgi:uncharacterized protein
MRPSIPVLTLGVQDLQISLEFYLDGLGFPTQGIVGEEFDDGAVVFIDLHNGMKLALFPSRSLAKDAGVAVTENGTPRISLGHNVATRQEVDDVMLQAERAGAAIVKPATDTFWGGYAGYFRDPDDYLWEVAWNPQMVPKD